MPPLRGAQKYLRGGAWLILLLADTGAALTLRALAAGRPLWFALITAAVLLVRVIAWRGGQRDDQVTVEDRRAAHSWSRMDISTSSYQRPSCSTDSR